MTQETIREIEQNLKNARKHVELEASLNRLYENRDFKAVIQHGYFEQEAIRLVSLKADPAFQTVERQAHVIRQIDSIGELQSYLRSLHTFAGRAKRDIEDGEQAIEELNAEVLTNE